MKVLRSVIIFCVAFSAFLNYASTYDHYKREANPLALADPEAEPGVAKKVATFCNETMLSSKSPKDFCKIVSQKIVEKVNHMCMKAIKFTCKVFTHETKHNCKQFLYSHLCPTLANGMKETRRLNVVEEEEDEDEDLDGYTTKKCESRMEPVYNQIESDGGFEYVGFCKNMRSVIEESCISSMEEMYAKAPWKPVQFVCKEYLSPWLCK